MLHPLATAAQGDEGNARVLAHRAALRGIPTTVTTVQDGALPDAEIYLVGGLDDDRMPVLAQRLLDGGLADRVAAGAVVLAVNAGYQVLGTTLRHARRHPPRRPRRARRALSRATTAFLGPVITRAGRPGPGRAERVREPPRHDRGAPVPSRSPPRAGPRQRRHSDGARRGTSSAPTCTARCSPATPTSPTCCSGGRRVRPSTPPPPPPRTPCAPSASRRTAPTRAGGVAGSTARPTGARGRPCAAQRLTRVRQARGVPRPKVGSRASSSAPGAPEGLEHGPGGRRPAG